MYWSIIYGQTIGKKWWRGSKFKGWEHFINAGGDNQEGYIGLQDHGDDVWFRNIKVKEL